jgi:hypothetical protein
MRDFVDDIRLIPTKLDQESQKQAETFYYWSEQLAGVEKEKDKQENRLKLRRAEIALQLRAKPPEGVKITEGTIEALLDSNLELNELKNALIEITHTANSMRAGVRALEQKKSMIENLSRLWLSGYFADPRMEDEDLGSEPSVDTLANSVRRGLNKKGAENGQD